MRKQLCIGLLVGVATLPACASSGEEDGGGGAGGGAGGSGGSFSVTPPAVEPGGAALAIEVGGERHEVICSAQSFLDDPAYSPSLPTAGHRQFGLNCLARDAAGGMIGASLTMGDVTGPGEYPFTNARALLYWPGPGVFDTTSPQVAGAFEGRIVLEELAVDAPVRARGRFELSFTKYVDGSSGAAAVVDGAGAAAGVFDVPVEVP